MKGAPARVLTTRGAKEKKKKKEIGPSFRVGALGKSSPHLVPFNESGESLRPTHGGHHPSEPHGAREDASGDAVGDGGERHDRELVVRRRSVDVQHVGGQRALFKELR